MYEIKGKTVEQIYEDIFGNIQEVLANMFTSESHEHRYQPVKYWKVKDNVNLNKIYEDVLHVFLEGEDKLKKEGLWQT